jgi:hypothetical protein
MSKKIKMYKVGASVMYRVPIGDEMHHIGRLLADTYTYIVSGTGVGLVMKVEPHKYCQYEVLFGKKIFKMHDHELVPYE